MHSLKSLIFMVACLALFAACSDDPQSRPAGAWGAAAKVVGALLSRGLIAETTTDSQTKADAALNRI